MSVVTTADGDGDGVDISAGEVADCAGVFWLSVEATGLGEGEATASVLDVADVSGVAVVFDSETGGVVEVDVVVGVAALVGVVDVVFSVVPAPPPPAPVSIALFPPPAAPEVSCLGNCHRSSARRASTAGVGRGSAATACRTTGATSRRGANFIASSVTQ